MQEDGSTTIPPFIASRLRSAGGTNGSLRAFSEDPNQEDIIAFAKSAILSLKEAMHGDLLLGPVIRVDVMLYQPLKGPERFVVNEFESLEAGISCSGRTGIAIVIDSTVTNYLVEYWSQQILSCLTAIAKTAKRRLF